MQYPIYIHKDNNSNYGATVPDLPGCYSAGKTIEEVLNNSREAIECHLKGLLADGDPMPVKVAIERHLDNPEFKDGVLAIVDVDLLKIYGAVAR